MFDLKQNEITTIEMNNVLGGDDIIIPPLVVPGTILSGVTGAAGHTINAGQITEITE